MHPHAASLAGRRLVSGTSDRPRLTAAESPLRPVTDMRAQLVLEPVGCPYAHSDDPDVSRRLMYAMFATQLEVFRVNLRGVQQRTDQLHRPNWQRLKDIRRAITDARFDIAPRHSHTMPLDRRWSAGADAVGPGGEEHSDRCELALVEEAVR